MHSETGPEKSGRTSELYTLGAQKQGPSLAAKPLFYLAWGQGFEPWLTGSESCIGPIGHHSTHQESMKISDLARSSGGAKWPLLGHIAE
jgi:hypothetical protein